MASSSASDPRGGGPASRPPMRRMMRLHSRLQAGEYPNCRKMARELEVSSKTVQRDIEFMRDQLALPIAYDRARLGFYYTEPVTSFPALEISAGEVVALYVAQKALLQFHGTSFERPLATAFRKLTESLRDKITFSWSEVDESISFHKLGTTEADLHAFEEISRAVLETRELTFEYRKLQSEAFEPRRLQPYHLGSIENQWYVIGFDLDRQQLRTFALTRLRNPRVEKARFERPVEFSIDRHLDQSFGAFAGGPNRYTVQIRFDPVAGQLVAERRWHASQNLKVLPDGEVELSLELCSLREIERWILSWGARARVLAPPALIERVRRTSEEMQKLYRK